MNYTVKNILKNSPENLFFGLIYIVIAMHLFVPYIGKVGVPLLQLGVLLATIISLIIKNKREIYFSNWRAISSDYKHIMIALALYFVVYAGFLILHGDGLKFLDYPLRRLIFLLFIPFLGVRYEKNIRYLKIALIIGGIGSLFISLSQYFGFNGNPIMWRVEGWYLKNPAEFGNLALLQGLVLFGLMRYRYNEPIKTRISNKAFTIISLVGYLIASFLSGTRGGWLIFPIFIIFEVYKKYQKHSLLKKMIAVVLLIGFLIGTVLLLATQQNPIKTRIDQAIHDVVNLEKNANTSMGQRLQMWKMALHVVQTQPISGIGAGAFAPMMDYAQKIGFLYPDEDLKKHYDCHQEILWNFVVGGSLLAFLWAYVFLNWLWYLLKNIKNSPLNQTVLTALVFYLITGLSVTWSMIQIRRDLFGLWMVLFLWLGMMAQQQVESNRSKKMTKEND